MNSTRVVRNASSIATITIFEYGNGHRVKYVLTDLDPVETTIISQDDNYYEQDDDALIAFEHLCKEWAEQLGQVSEERVEQTAHDAFKVFVRSIPTPNVFVTSDGKFFIIASTAARFSVRFGDDGNICWLNIS